MEIMWILGLHIYVSGTGPSFVHCGTLIYIIYVTLSRLIVHVFSV